MSKIFDLYDPLLVQTNAKGKWPAWEDGYKLYPKTERLDSARKIMTIGNSTSIWPEYPWSTQAADILKSEGTDVVVYNGAGKGHSSAQEMLRVVRDAPGIKPDVILAFSGICDFGFLMTSQKNSLYHKYHRSVTEHLLAAGAIGSFTPGYPNQLSDSERWLHNHRLAKLAAEEIGARYIAILQPVLGYGRYDPTDAERQILDEKAQIILRGGTETYIDRLTHFYDTVRSAKAADPIRYAHVHDLTDVYDGGSGVWLDHRHPNRAGCKVLARAVADIIAEALASGRPS